MFLKKLYISLPLYYSKHKSSDKISGWYYFIQTHSGALLKRAKKAQVKFSAKIDIHASCFFTKFLYIHQTFKRPARVIQRHLARARKCRKKCRNEVWLSSSIGYVCSAMSYRAPPLLRWTCVVS